MALNASKANNLEQLALKGSTLQTCSPVS